MAQIKCKQTFPLPCSHRAIVSNLFARAPLICSKILFLRQIFMTATATPLVIPAFLVDDQSKLCAVDGPRKDAFKYDDGDRL